MDSASVAAVAWRVACGAAAVVAASGRLRRVVAACFCCAFFCDAGALFVAPCADAVRFVARCCRWVSGSARADLREAGFSPLSAILWPSSLKLKAHQRRAGNIA